MTAPLLDQTGATGLIPTEIAIADRLRNAILDRVLPPGSKLPEEHLAEAFDTTRARIRRVLLALSREHIVELLPSRGAFVARPSPQDARHVLAARRVLEIGTIEHPCQPLTEDAVTQLQGIIEEERASHHANNAVKMIRLSGQFHIELARAIGNDVIVVMLQELILRTSLIIASFERQKATCCLTSDHGQILTSLQRNATTEATRLMSRHLLEIEQNLDFTTIHTPVTSLSALLAMSAPGL